MSFLVISCLVDIKWKPINLTQKHVNYTSRSMQAWRIPVIITVIHAILLEIFQLLL